MFDVRIMDNDAVLFDGDIEVMNLEHLRKDGEIQYDFPDGSYVNIFSNNSIIWFDSDCNLHRDGDMPTIICTNGRRAYHKNGKLHRVGGPARIWEDGYEEYYLDDIEYTKEEF